ncbi:serine hydrolase domain-containing protein [Bacillus sp. OAE603]|uniref:serine hydrolase domain-containing protein n=1 Tax=Gottfriedia sp. OAE603 TaxID=2663872 RepID=UPI00178B5469
MSNITNKNDVSTVFYQELEEIMKRYKIIGCQAVSVYKEQVIWSDSFGDRDVENMQSVSENTMFRIASISKLFTATAIMQLFERQQLTLDSDISDYLGFEVRNPKHPNLIITLKQLLTHTSSLTSDEESNSIYAKFIKDGQASPSVSLKELLVPGGKYYTPQIWGDWQPGTSSNWVYSNIGAIICGAIIEQVSGNRFDSFIQQNIFKTLGMENVAFSYAGMKKDHEFGNLYVKDENTKKYMVTIQDATVTKFNIDSLKNYIPGTHGGLFEPQGGLRTTAFELSKFLRALMNGEFNGTSLLKEETLNMMKSVHWMREEEKHFFSKMGLGLHISHDFLSDYKEMIGHAGEAYGLISNLFWNEEKKFGMIFILNGASINLQNNSRLDVEKELAEVIFKHTIKQYID